MPFPELHPALMRALESRNYTEPTPVQEAVLREETADRDLLVSAQTGSGKTAAYGLVLGEMLLGDAERFPAVQQPLALIVAPTRELAMQVQKELAWLLGAAGARVLSCVGGMDIRREQRALAAGAHVIVGTPGRLADHLDQRHLNLAGVRAVVLDEADEMLDMGFREELESLLNATPPERRTMLFSATLPKAILGMAKRYQHNALRLALSSENEQHGDIEYRAFPIRPRDSEHAVVNTLRFFDARGALVFCGTREAVRHLHANLQERGFSAVALSGELKQHERTTALQALRDGRVRVCVATDVAARGLDMPDLGLVIHADLPQNKEMMLHRSGRTGRAGRKGLSVVIVPAQSRGTAMRLFESAKIKAIWSPAPSADEIRAKDEANLVNEIAGLTEASAEEDMAAGRVLLGLRSAEELAAVLVRIRREALPAPEIIEDPGPYKKESWPKKPGSSWAAGKRKAFGAGGPRKSFGAGSGRTFADKKKFAAGKTFEPSAGKTFADKKKFSGKKTAGATAGAKTFTLSGEAKAFGTKRIWDSQGKKRDDWARPDRKKR